MTAPMPEQRTEALTDPNEVVGHKSFDTGEIGPNGFPILRHEPITRAEADKIWLALENARQRRAREMPTEKEALVSDYDPLKILLSGHEDERSAFEAGVRVSANTKRQAFCAAMLALLRRKESLVRMPAGGDLGKTAFMRNAAPHEAYVSALDDAVKMLARAFQEDCSLIDKTHVWVPVDLFQEMADCTTGALDDPGHEICRRIAALMDELRR